MEFNVKKETVPTYQIQIYMAGDLSHARQVLRQYCTKNPLCVTLIPSDYIYAGGLESGFVVGLINYPRFPTVTEILLERAEEIVVLTNARRLWYWDGEQFERFKTIVRGRTETEVIAEAVDLVMRRADEDQSLAKAMEA